MSNGLPPPPDFLSIAMQAQQARRQAEQDRLQQLQIMQQRQSQIVQDLLPAITSGTIKPKDIAGLPGFHDVTASTINLLELNAKAAKAQKAEQDKRAAAETLIPDLTRLGTEAPNTEAFGQGVSQLAQLLGQDAAPILESISARAQMAPTLGALDQLDAQRKEKQALARKEAEVAIEQMAALGADAIKRKRDLEGKMMEEVRLRATSLYTNFYSDLLINGGSDEQLSKMEEQILSDPAMGGKYAPAALAVIKMDALSARRAAQSEIEIRNEIQERTGYRVNPRVAKAVADGKAMEDAFTGIPMSAKDEATRNRLANVGAAMDALASAKAAAIRVASAGKGGRLSQLATLETSRSIGAGSSDLDVNAYDASKKLVGDMMTLALSGQQAAQQQIERLQAIMPKFTELEKDPKTGGLTPAAARRIDTAFALVRSLASNASMLPPKETQEIYQSKFNERVQYHQDRLSEVAPNASGPGAVRGGSDPRFPTIEVP